MPSDVAPSFLSSDDRSLVSLVGRPTRLPGPRQSRAETSVQLSAPLGLDRLRLVICQGELGFQGMKAMARQRSHSIEFKRQVAQEFIAGESTRFPQSISLSRQER